MILKRDLREFSLRGDFVSLLWQPEIAKGGAAFVLDEVTGSSTKLCFDDTSLSVF